MKEEMSPVVKEAINTLKAEIDRLVDKIQYIKDLKRCVRREKDFRDLEILDAKEKIRFYKNAIRTANDK